MVAWGAVALPWLWPWAPPPSPSAPGLLAAWGLTAAWWATLACTSPRSPESLSPRVLVALAGLLAWAAWRMPVTDLALLGGLAGSILCIGVAARCVSRTSPVLLLHVVWALLTAAVLSAGIAGLQYSGLLHQPSAALSWLHASPNEEAYGQLRQRNQFGSLMSLGLAAWMYLAQSGGFRPRWRATAWAGLLVLTLGQVACASRTGALTWIGLCLLTLVWPMQTPHHPSSPGVRRGAAAALVGFVILCWALPALTSSLATVELPKVSALDRWVEQPEGLGICESRIVLWRHVLELSLQRPWLGWGWGELDYAHATQPVQGERFCGQLGHAHNLWLQVVVEWGWPLALSGLGAVLLWLRRHTPWRARSPAAVLGWSWLAVIGVHSLLEFPLWYGPFQVTLGMAIGLAGAAARQAEGAAESAPPSPPTITRGLIALWFVCTVWAGWDYHRVSQIFQPATLRSQACRDRPLECLADVVWFHQGRDFALLRLNAEAMGAGAARELAQRVAHFSPEPWVLDWLARPDPASGSQPNR